MLSQDVVGSATGLNELVVEIGLAFLRLDQDGCKLAVEDERSPFSLVSILALIVAQEVAKVDMKQMPYNNNNNNKG